MANKITVKFEARGAKELRAAINNLAVAQKNLEKGTAAAERLQKKLNRQLGQTNKHTVLGVRNTRNQASAFSVLRSKLLLASFAFGLVNASILKLGKAYGTQEEAENRLRHAIGGSIDSLKIYASELQKTTRFGDEETLGAMTLVAAYTENERAIASLTKAAQNLATAKGMDLRTATDMLAKSVFSSTNSMQRYGISISGAASSSDRLNSALSAVSTQAGGAATADVDTFNGAIDQMNNAIGDAAEDIGEVLAPAIIAVANGIKFLSERMDAKTIVTWGTAIAAVASSSWIAERAIKALKNQTIALNMATKKNVFLFGATIALAVLIDKFKLFGDVLGDSEDKVDSLNDKIEEGMNIGKGFEDIKSIRDYNEALDMQKIIIDEVNAAKGNMIPVIVSETQATEKLAESIDSTNQATNEFFIDLQNLPAAVEEVSGVLAEGGDMLEGWSILAPEVAENLSLMGEGMEFVEAATDSMNDSVGEVSITYEGMIEAYDKSAASIDELILLEEREAAIAAKVLELKIAGIKINEKHTESETALALARGDINVEEAKRLDMAAKLTEAEALLNAEVINATQFDTIKNQLLVEEIELTRELTAAKLESANMVMDSMEMITGELQSQLDRRISMELDSLKKTEKYKGASSERQEQMEDDVIKEYEKKRRNLFMADKALAISEIYIQTELAAMKAMGQTGIFGLPMAGFIRAQGVVAAGIAAMQPFPEYEYGGLIGGQRHAQGGTMINAERGEFVMRRDAVESIGVDNLEAMNQGGGGSSIVINNPIISSEFVETELPELIAEAVRKGADFGMS